MRALCIATGLLSYAGGAALANVMRTIQGVDWKSTLPTKLVATATSLEGSKKPSDSFIYGQRSTNPENFVKIGPVDVDIIGLTEITKI